MKREQLSKRIGNIDGILIEEAMQCPNYGKEKVSMFRKFVAAAAVLALMVCSGAVGAFAFGRETVIEVPAHQETINMEEIGLTVVLPDSWKGKYYADIDGSICTVYSKEIRDADPSWGGCLFYIDRVYDRAVTPEELYEMSPVACKYLFATENQTYALCYASDVQWNINDPEQEAIYQQMREEISQIRFIIDDVLAEK